MEYLRFVLENTNPSLTACFAVLLGICLVVSVSGAVRETDESTALELSLIYIRRATVILLAVSIPLFIAGTMAYAYVAFGYNGERTHQYFSLWMAEILDAISGLWWSFLVLLIAPIFIRAAILRWLKPSISRWLRKFRVTQSGDSLSDIRVEMGRINAKDFVPSDYYKDGYMFVGLDEKKAPVYIPDEIFLKNHSKVIGPSQTGKGVLIGVIMDQVIKKGWGAWFFDIKPDDFVVDVMRESCERNERPAIEVLDFNGIGPGAYGPFIGGSRRERRERVVKAYAIADKGSSADFYKQNERKVLDMLMPIWDGTIQHFQQLLRGKHPEISDKDRAWIAQNSGSLESNTNEFLQLDTMRATVEESFDVNNALQNRSVVYVRSHMHDTVVKKATVALLDEIVQIALRQKLPHPVFISVDECRFVISDTIANALAAVLSKNVFMQLAYQSLNDLLNLPDKSLNAESIKSATEINTQITLSYRANDFDTAEWVSSLTGKTLKSVTKLEKVEVNKGGAEEWAGERSIGHEEENLISENVLLALPPRVCALIRPNALATMIYTCWVPIKNPQGMPLKATTKKSKQAALTASAIAPSIQPTAVAEAASFTEPVDDDPFAETPHAAAGPAISDQVQAEYEEDPFAALYEDQPEYGEMETQTVEQSDDPFSVIDQPEQEQPKSKPKKGELTPDQLAAIENAASGLLATKAKPSANTAQTNTKKVDLSSLDDIEGI